MVNKYYKGAKPRSEDKGSFGNRGQKLGKKVPVRKEKLAKTKMDRGIKKVAAGMLKHIKATSTDGMMHVQPNA